ncbi:MAG: tyrosine-type recombinase/integrase [Chloroflexi bacterium]|nr:tyrosine-type recombinase/integrase [Chloroflexota bacterium]
MTSLIPDFTTYLRERDRAALTIAGYVADVQLFAKWFEQTNGETFAPPAITPSDVREYRQHLLNVDRRKANTINRKLAALSVFMQFAIETHLIEHDPTTQIKHVEESPRGPKYLDKQQQFALQRAIEKDLQYSQARYPRRWLSRRRDASLVLFLWHTGLRVSEAIALTKRDVQLSERKGQITVRGKGTKQRIVPLNAEARQALQAWLDARPETANDAVWVSVETDAALSARSVQRVLKRYGRAAHIDDLTPHVLRHCFGKNLIDAQVSIDQVAALLGHSNLNTTRIYLTPSEQDLEKAVEMIELR